LECIRFIAKLNIVVTCGDGNATQEIVGTIDVLRDRINISLPGGVEVFAEHQDGWTVGMYSHP
jgi:hypothetical protein